MRLLTDAKKCAWNHFIRLHPDMRVDPQGYVLEVKDNLVEGVDADLIKQDYDNGSGQEWDYKIKAVHSSAALAANTFGFFKDKHDALELLGVRGFSCPRLEAKCPSGLRGTPPNLDALVESNQDVIGVESKFLETLTEKKADFSPAYSRQNLPQCEPMWWEALEQAGKLGECRFDRAQIIKHYLGLRHTYRADERCLHLLYLYWEPANANSLPAFQEHRDQLSAFARQVSGSVVHFHGMSYRELWERWESIPGIAGHVRNLRARYDFPIVS
jgi:hypothetical protein